MRVLTYLHVCINSAMSQIDRKTLPHKILAFEVVDFLFSLDFACIVIVMNMFIKYGRCTCMRSLLVVGLIY